MKKLTETPKRIKWDKDFNGQKMVYMEDNINSCIVTTVYTKFEIEQLLKAGMILLQ